MAARVAAVPTRAAAPAVARTTAITSAPEKRARSLARAMSMLPLRQPLQHSPRQAPASSPTAPAARRSKKTPPMRSILISLTSSQLPLRETPTRLIEHQMGWFWIPRASPLRIRYRQWSRVLPRAWHAVFSPTIRTTRLRQRIQPQTQQDTFGRLQTYSDRADSVLSE